MIEKFDVKLVFAYTLYDEESKREIISKFVDSIFALFFSYEQSKGINNPRLLSKAMEEGKIKLREVEKLKKDVS